MFGSDLRRCPKCNQYIPDRCTCDQWQSNAQWPKACYQGMYGDGVSTDIHRTKEAALNVCNALREEGFGCMGEYFPIKTWINKVNVGNPILDELRKNLEVAVEAAMETTKQLQKARIVPDEKLKERFDI